MKIAIKTPSPAVDYLRAVVSYAESNAECDQCYAETGGVDVDVFLDWQCARTHLESTRWWFEHKKRTA